MKILVTGGNGMVGNNIKEIISLFPNNEFVFSNRSLQNENSVDLTKITDVFTYFEKNKFDSIIHLAADVGGLFKNLKNNTSIFSNNILINENIFKACIKYKVNRGIFILSSCIFPCEPKKFPMNEDMIHESPPHYSNEGYAYAKRMMHLQCNNFNKDFGTEFICLVPVNLYGSHDNFNPEDSHLIPGLMHRFFNSNEKYTAYGSGRPLRQFLYAKDFAKIICNILINKPEIKSGSFICCDDEEYSISEIVTILCDVMNINYDKVHWDTSKSDGCMKKTVTNELFKDYFPHFTFTSLQEGLEETYDWYKKNIDLLRV